MDDHLVSILQTKKDLTGNRHEHTQQPVQNFGLFCFYAQICTGKLTRWSGKNASFSYIGIVRTGRSNNTDVPGAPWLLQSSSAEVGPCCVLDDSILSAAASARETFIAAYSSSSSASIASSSSTPSCASPSTRPVNSESSIIFLLPVVVCNVSDFRSFAHSMKLNGNDSIAVD